MTGRRFGWVLATVVALFAAAGAWAQDVVKKDANLVEVTVAGVGTSKDEAVLDAKRKAVEKGAGTYLYSQSQTKDFVLVKDTVLARAAGFLQEYKELSAKEMDDGTWEVKISATVSIKGIEDTWGVVTNLLKDMGRPKIMVFINEKIRDREKGVDEIVEDATVQTRIEERLLKSGFLLVDKRQLKEIDKKDLAAAAAEDKPEKVQAIAKRFGAQIFIAGSANAMPGQEKNIGGVLLYTYEAEANIKVFKSDTAQMMSAVPGVATRGVQQVWRSAAKQALDSQAQSIAPKVVEDILQHWMDWLAGRGELKLEVENITFAQYTKLKAGLKAIKEVKDITADFHNNVADISIQSDAGAERLAEKIAVAMPQVEISDVTNSVIKAKYKSD